MMHVGLEAMRTGILFSGFVDVSTGDSTASEMIYELELKRSEWTWCIFCRVGFASRLKRASMSRWTFDIAAVLLGLSWKVA